MTRISFSPEPILDQKLKLVPLDLRITTPEQNFGCSSLAREINEIYTDSPKDIVVWQPDVYAEARIIADRWNIKRIVDVGCGDGTKLMHHFPLGLFKTIGIDFHGSLELARSTYCDATWVGCDLNAGHDLAQLFAQVDTEEPILLILADVIEHLPDPRTLLAQLRSVLLCHVASRLVLSTPDRSRLNYKTNDYPANYSHVREWTHDELTSFFLSAGFQVERSGHTRANQFDEQHATIYIQLRCEIGEYIDFLRTTGLLNGHTLPCHLLLTSEYADLPHSGGIGTFVAEQRAAYGVDNTLCMIVRKEDNLDSVLLSQFSCITPQMLLDSADLALPIEEIALKATTHLMFYFPSLAKVEYADYEGLGCRLVQAKCACLLPTSTQMIVHCHGATHYLENANQTWFGSSHFKVAEREKVSIENADRIVFPTAFLRDLYRETGLDMDDEKILYLRYPYDFKPAKIEQTEPVDTIVFYGKRSTMKGYSLFLSALVLGVGQLLEIGINRLVFIGLQTTNAPEDTSSLDVLNSHFQLEEFTSLDRSAAITKLQTYANKSYCVMPYLCDNHPYAFLDVAFAGILPLMLNAGGVAEIFPEQFRRDLLADPTETSLLTKMLTLARMSVSRRHRLRENFLKTMISTQEAINDGVRQFSKVVDPIQPRPQSETGKATIIVPIYNTDLHFISDLVFGLNNQSMPPQEVIFVNDASQEGYASDLEKHLDRELLLPYRIIHHASNKGLAGARNTGLGAANTEYVINVDSDDVPMNDFVRNIVHCLDADPKLAAAVPYLKAFEEDVDFNKRAVSSDVYVYRPLGDGLIASQLDNNLGHANSGYRTNTLRTLGGWDESEKSMWEDWALFLKLVSLGHRIGVIPQVDCLYRVRKQSMLRTYKVWPAMKRLARNMGGLSRYENFRLQAYMRNTKELEAETLVLRSDIIRVCKENAALKEELNRRSVRSVHSIVNALSTISICIQSCTQRGTENVENISADPESAII